MPHPTPQQIQVVIVHKTADDPKMPAAQIEAMNSSAIDAFLTAKGDDPVQRIDPNDIKDYSGAVPARFAPAIAAMTGKQPPYLFITAKDGKLLAGEPLPADETTELSFIQKYTGK